jgi:hypothetical protein
MRLITISLLSIILGFASWSAFAVCQGEAVHLFFIERSKNKNVVQYDICLTKNNDPLDSSPVTAYWILQDGQREKLNRVEKEHAYGIASQEEIAKDKFRVRLVASKSREIIVEKIGGSFKAVLSIDGKESILEKVYVQAKEELLVEPKVLYIDLFGRAIDTNLPVRERIIPGHG